MQIDQDAPIKYTESIHINAPIERVWRTLSDIEKWPVWNPEVRSARLLGELKPGTRFRWMAGPGFIFSVLQAVEPPSLLGWTGKTLGIRAVHVWRLEEKHGGTVATSEESWNGMLPKLLRRLSEKSLKGATATNLIVLKETCERSSLHE